MKTKYFSVCAKCGHVGKSNYILIDYAVPAENAKEAARKTREYKRVKHDHLDAIRSVTEISFDDFIKLKSQNDADPYLHCKNIQEQRKIENFESRVISEELSPKPKKKRSTFKYHKQLARETEFLAWQNEIISEVYSA